MCIHCFLLRNAPFAWASYNATESRRWLGLVAHTCFIWIAYAPSSDFKWGALRPWREMLGMCQAVASLQKRARLVLARSVVHSTAEGNLTSACVGVSGCALRQRDTVIWFVSRRVRLQRCNGDNLNYNIGESNVTAIVVTAVTVNVLVHIHRPCRHSSTTMAVYVFGHLRPTHVYLIHSDTPLVICFGGC